MLDQFRAINASHKQRRRHSMRALSVVYCTREILVEDGTIYLPWLSLRRFVFRAYHDAIRMQEVEDSRSLPEKLRIGGDAERIPRTRITGVNTECTL
jgi:hypothetical protein